MEWGAVAGVLVGRRGVGRPGLVVPLRPGPGAWRALAPVLALALLAPTSPVHGDNVRFFNGTTRHAQILCVETEPAQLAARPRFTIDADCPNPADGITRIDFASLGRPAGACGAYSTTSDGCHHDGSFELAKAACQSKRSCHFELKAATLLEGVPCDGSDPITFKMQWQCGFVREVAEEDELGTAEAATPKTKALAGAVPILFVALACGVAIAVLLVAAYRSLRKQQAAALQHDDRQEPLLALNPAVLQEQQRRRRRQRRVRGWGPFGRRHHRVDAEDLVMGEIDDLGEGDEAIELQQLRRGGDVHDDGQAMLVSPADGSVVPASPHPAVSPHTPPRPLRARTSGMQPPKPVSRQSVRAGLADPFARRSEPLTRPRLPPLRGSLKPGRPSGGERDSDGSVDSDGL